MNNEIPWKLTHVAQVGIEGCSENFFKPVHFSWPKQPYNNVDNEMSDFLPNLSGSRPPQNDVVHGRLSGKKC